MNTQKKVGIIQFPGSNCERETAFALKQLDIDVHYIRWNQEKHIKNMHALVLPGGFSFQDRIRSGAIASKLPLSSHIITAAKKGVPILGICNGCQILAEMGLIPDLNNTSSLSCAFSNNRKNQQNSGFTCDWTYVCIKQSDKNIFTQNLPEEIAIPIQINHQEGRFVTDISQESLESACSIMYYCDAKVSICSDLPTNPNGSRYNIAGIGNKAGNVFAMMPHPERAISSYQIPSWIEAPKDPLWTHFFSALTRNAAYA